MLIDSEKLKQAILTTMPERSEVLLIVDNQPDAVVRCKDCIYAKVAPDDNGYFYCGVPFAPTAPHEAYFYCASGKRKDDVKEIEAFLREKEPFMFEWHDGGDDIY